MSASAALAVAATIEVPGGADRGGHGDDCQGGRLHRGAGQADHTDQPGLYVWTREEKGRLVAGCDSSLPSAEEAWDEVKFMVAEVLAEVANMSPAEWKALTAEERQAAIVEQFC